MVQEPNPRIEIYSVGTIDKRKMKAVVKETFNMVSNKYDNPALRFFPESAAHLASGIMLQSHEEVLDVATRTGHAGKPRP